MTRSTVKKLNEPLEEPEREMHKRRKATSRQQQNESLAIAGRNPFDDEASSSVNSKPKITSLIKSLREHSSPNASIFLNLIILPEEPTNKVLDAQDILLIQDTCSFQGLCTKNPIHHIKYFLSIVDHLQADGATNDASRLCFFHFSLKVKAKEWLDKISPETITNDTLDHDSNWTDNEEEDKAEEVQAVSFYLKKELFGPLEWNVSKNKLKSSMEEPTKVELKALPDNLESSFDHCLSNLDKMLTRYEETNLVLNWEKCHFMVKEGIVLGHEISRAGIELEELRLQAYETFKTYKERIKKWHDNRLKDKKEFRTGDYVLLFNSRLKLFLGKLKSRWSGPFTVKQAYSYETIELFNCDGTSFKVIFDEEKPESS
ncbi:hypothetical protein Tco_0823972 [Tanacetum coccineum]|uniref:Reverse transcriptase domain-containing protein n=1 Tax=Tanacetum coccineum TaxID=301880 RepID=A0ABQ5ANJ9_9ASTR